MNKVLGRIRNTLAATAAIAALAASPAHAEWWKAETDHFIIYSEDSREDTEEFARELERFDNALRTIQALPIKPEEELSDANKVTIFREGRVSGIAKLAGAPGSGIAGFYIPRAGAPVAFTPVQENIADIRSIRQRARNTEAEMDPRSILQHEYVHHFMLQTFPATYPDWYIEAFAELYATIELYEDGTFHLGNPPQYRSFQIYNLRSFPLKQMFDQNHERSGLDRLQFYGTGWMVAHYLSFNPERRPQLFQYLKAIGEGQDGLTAAKAAFGDLDKLQDEVDAYKREAKLGKLPGFDIKPADYVAPAVAMRELTAAEESVINLYMRSKRGVDRKDAKEVASGIEAKAAEYPESLFVQLAAAEAFVDARRYDDADRAVDRALALDPNSSQAWLFKAKSIMGRAEYEAKDMAMYSDARAPLAKATELDPQNPEPLILYYETYRRAGEAPSENAIIALESVFESAAFDAAYRMILARQLLIELKGPLAKTVLAPIAFSFHGDQENNKLGQVIDLIDEQKNEEARDKLIEIMDEAEQKAKES